MLAGGDEIPGRGDKLDREQVVAGQPELAVQPAGSAPEGETPTPVVETLPPTATRP